MTVAIVTRISPETEVQVVFDPRDEARPVELYDNQSLEPVSHEDLTGLQREAINQAMEEATQ